MTKTILAFALILLTYFTAVEKTLADTLNLGASKDNTLYQDASGSLSNGAGPTLFAGVTGSGGPGILRGLIMFDIAAQVPEGSTITDVTLTLRLSASAADVPDNIKLHRLTGDWGAEDSIADRGVGGGGAGGTAQNGDATWLHQFSPGNNWDTPGGDFSTTVSATTSVNDFNFDEDEENFYDWNSAQLTNDVQDMLDDAQNNFGWILLGNENFAETARRFDSSDSFLPANRPVLTVEFDPPAGFNADFDNDNDVDGDDLDDWSAAFGTGNGGDTDDDNDSDGADFLAWQQEFTGPGPLQTATVPEPTSATLSVAMLIFVALNRRVTARRGEIH